MEWILAEKKTSIPVEVWQMDNTYKKDSIPGCVKLLDTRGIFDELAFIGNGDSAFVAFAVAYTIDEKNGTSSFLEKTFTLDKNGKVLDCNDTSALLKRGNKQKKDSTKLWNNWDLFSFSR